MKKNSSCHLWPHLMLTTALALSLPALAYANGIEAVGAKTGANSNANAVLLNANSVTYDDHAKQVTAEGDVTFASQGRQVRADKLVYDQNLDIVTASGNVRIWDEDKNMVVAGTAVLSRDMQQGFVEKIALVLSDNSRFAAAEGERTEGRYTRMNHGLYTACDVCHDNPDTPPLWQVRAERIIHDNERKDVTYRNAWLEMAGIPVFYTPYLSHPDPSVKQRSGFIAPVIGSRSNLGFIARNYYYLDVAPSMDATIETSYSTDRGVLLGGEWRQEFEHGSVRVNASATRDNIPLDTETNQLRGHFFLTGIYRFDENWVASADIKRSTDDTYLELWNYSDDDILDSRAALDYYQQRTHGVVEAISFQDLRENADASEPQIVRASWSTQGEPDSVLGGRVTVSTQMRGVARPEGQNSSRASVATGWRRQDILPGGFLIVSEANARIDAYATHNIDQTDKDVSTARPFAQTQLTTSWPLVQMAEQGQRYLEPVAQLTLSPRQEHNPLRIPNEDSVGLEFDTTNLFSANRYAGQDKQDGGQRLAYGLKGGWNGQQGSSVNVIFGQSYDFADQPNYPVHSGLENKDSDYVGNVTAMFSNWLDTAYALRLDNETLKAKEHDLRMSLGPKKLHGTVNYVYAEQPSMGRITTGNREEVTVAGRWTLVPRWTVSASHRQDLQNGGQPLTSGLKVEYQDECFVFSVIGSRDYVSRAGLDSGDSIFFRLQFKNLGAFESPSFSPDAFSSTK